MHAPSAGLCIGARHSGAPRPPVPPRQARLTSASATTHPRPAHRTAHAHPGGFAQGGRATRRRAPLQLRPATLRTHVYTGMQRSRQRGSSCVLCRQPARHRVCRPASLPTCIYVGGARGWRSAAARAGRRPYFPDLPHRCSRIKRLLCQSAPYDDATSCLGGAVLVLVPDWPGPPAGAPAKWAARGVVLQTASVVTRRPAQTVRKA